MPFAFRRIALSGLLVAAGLAVSVFPASSQGVIEFGTPHGEDALLGGGYGHSPVSGGERRGGEYRDVQQERRGFGSGHGHDGGGYYVPGRILNDYRPVSRSVIHARRVRGPAFYRGTGIFANAVGSGGSVVFYGAPPAPVFVTRDAPGPKIIDVEAERLDRQPIGPSGVRVEQRGATKIIRLASGYGEAPVSDARSHAERALTEAGPVFYPDPAAPAVAADDLEPWTEAWMQHCVERYETFDASLGTFTDETGRRHFCIAPAE